VGKSSKHKGIRDGFQPGCIRAPVNSAHLPTALAPDIGLASREKRVDKGERGRARVWIIDRCRQLILGSIFLGCGWLSGCGGSRQANSLRPTLSYNGSQPFPAVAGEAILLTPAVSGSIDGYVVSPELPPGLLLNGVTGVISGTPARASAAATFAVTATYRGGHSTFLLVLSVTEPPTHLSYPGPVTGTVGAALTPLKPKIAGTVEHYSVTPALPAGVVLDGRSGLIAGTPSVASILAPYTITASSQAGNTSFIFLLAVAGPSARSNH
jgi:Putative Ig domain